jgi:two-component system, NtrC family, sensor kinase
VLRRTDESGVYAYAIDALVIDPKLSSTEHVPTLWIETKLVNAYVIIQIKDNGIGISDIHKPHLFDPFFTAKPIGSGTGLGLSVFYQAVVQQHGGKLECHSQLGEGSEFLITIPLQQSAMSLAA